MGAKTPKLTIKQEKFCNKYVECGEYGNYWSAVPHNRGDTGAMSLWFNRNRGNVSAASRAHGYSLRCVTR